MIDGCKNNTGACAQKQRPAPGADAKTLDEFLEHEQLRERLGRIRHKIMVMSGKGGVGKSTVAVNLAVSLGLAGRRVGILDVDIHGPSIPQMLHLEDARVQSDGDGLQPVAHAGLKVMSLGFLLNNRDDAVIWRGPLKMSVIKQFLKDVAWGDLDYLIIDSPPGTGDEPLSVAQLAAPVTGAVIVTTPQSVATADVRKSINFCRQLKMPVLGVVENMSGFVCPKCGEVSYIFNSGGGEKMAEAMQVPFLGRIPIDANVGLACDAGAPFVYHYSRTETAKAFERVIAPVLALSENGSNKNSETQINNGEQDNMKIAIPMADGKLCLHFGHCEQFALIEADPQSKKIIGRKDLTPPPHEPGVLPKWLHEQGANMIIAGGMGQRAQSLFAEHGIKVVVGASGDTPDKLVISYLDGSLVSGTNVCDH